MKKFFNIYRNCLLVIALLFAIVTILPIFLQVEPFVVLSGSMEPTISTGDICYIKPFEEGAEPQIGDIVAFSADGGKTVVLHRIVDREYNRFITKGDANESVDIFAPSVENIKGYASFIVPYIGPVITWIQSSKGIITVVVLILISILSSFLDDGKEKEKKNKKKKSKDEEMVFEDAFEKTYKTIKEERSNKPRLLSELVKERHDVMEEKLEKEKNQWADEFDKLDEYVIGSDVNVEKEEKANENIDNDIAIEEFDFDNLSVEDETQKILDSYSLGSLVIDEADGEKMFVLEKESVETVEVSDNDIADALSLTAAYKDKYLADEDDSTFEEDTEEVNINNWSFMVDDIEDSIFIDKYKNSVIKSIKRKIDSSETNESDNFSHSSILRRAEEAMKDDLTAEELEIIKILMNDSEQNNSPSEKTEKEDLNNIDIEEKNKNNEEYCGAFGVVEKENLIVSDESIKEKNKIESEEESGEAEVISDEIINGRLINEETKIAEKPE